MIPSRKATAWARVCANSMVNTVAPRSTRSARSVEVVIAGRISQRAGPGVNHELRTPPSAREEIQHQTIALGGVLVGGPVSRVGNAVQVERAHGLPNLPDQKIGRPELRVVALA